MLTSVSMFNWLCRFSPSYAADTVSITRAQPRDCVAMEQIQELSAVGYWEAELFSQLLRRQDIMACVGRSCIVRNGSEESDEKIVGYTLAKKTLDDRAEILTIRVLPKYQGRGIGRGLLSAVLSELYRDRVKSAFLEVESSNQKGIKLYRGMGFVSCSERRSNNKSDIASPPGTVLLMKLSLAE